MSEKSDTTFRERALLKEEEVDLHRFFECPYYSKCLNEAAIYSYESFTCTYCFVLLNLFLNSLKGKEKLNDETTS